MFYNFTDPRKQQFIIGVNTSNGPVAIKSQDEVDHFVEVTRERERERERERGREKEREGERERES